MGRAYSFTSRATQQTVTLNAVLNDFLALIHPGGAAVFAEEAKTAYWSFLINTAICRDILKNDDSYANPDIPDDLKRQVNVILVERYRFRAWVEKP